MAPLLSADWAKGEAPPQGDVLYSGNVSVATLYTAQNYFRGFFFSPPFTKVLFWHMKRHAESKTPITPLLSLRAVRTPARDRRMRCQRLEVLSCYKAGWACCPFQNTLLRALAVLHKSWWTFLVNINAYHPELPSAILSKLCHGTTVDNSATDCLQRCKYKYPPKPTFSQPPPPCQQI